MFTLKPQTREENENPTWSPLPLCDSETQKFQCIVKNGEGSLISVAWKNEHAFLLSHAFGSQLRTKLTPDIIKQGRNFWDAQFYVLLSLAADSPGEMVFCMPKLCSVMRIKRHREHLAEAVYALPTAHLQKEQKDSNRNSNTNIHIRS